MTGPQRIAPTETERVARTLELAVTRRLDGLLRGQYLGVLPGPGWDVGEARAYVPGDDVRRIDWSLTARTDEVQVRDTIVEWELEATLVIDLSPSIAFGTALYEKRDLALAAAAAVGFLATKTVGRLGGVILEAEGEVIVPARLESSPTAERAQSREAIEGLELGRGTAIGDAIFLGLGALSGSNARLASVESGRAGDGEMPPGRLVVMSDGETTTGRENDEAVRAARDAGVEISTIAYGTDSGTVLVQGETIPVPVNRDALAQIASDSDGVFYEAASGEELSQVFEDIGTAIELDTVTEELSLWFVGLGMVLSALAAAGSLAWFSRLP